MDLAEILAVKYADYIDFQGVYTHAGQSYKSRNISEIKLAAENERDVISKFVRKLRDEKKIRCPTVSIGSTPTCSLLPDDMAEVTEIHPGNYIFYDWMQSELGTCSVDSIAVSVLARVVGHYPQKKTLLVDAGALAMFSDQGCVHLHQGSQFGVVVGHPEMRLVALTQELGKIQNINGEIDYDKFPIGSLVRIYPNHSCLTAALYSEYHIIEDGKVVNQWRPIKGW